MPTHKMLWFYIVRSDISRAITGHIVIAWGQECIRRAIFVRQLHRGLSAALRIKRVQFLNSLLFVSSGLAGTSTPGGLHSRAKLWSDMFSMRDELSALEDAASPGLTSSNMSESSALCACLCLLLEMCLAGTFLMHKVLVLITKHKATFAGWPEQCSGGVRPRNRRAKVKLV